MNQIPNCNPQELQKLDEKILSTNQKGNKLEKAKKDIFKRLTSQVSIYFYKLTLCYSELYINCISKFLFSVLTVKWL